MVRERLYHPKPGLFSPGRPCQARVTRLAKWAPRLQKWKGVKSRSLLLALLSLPAFAVIGCIDGEVMVDDPQPPRADGGTTITPDGGRVPDGGSATDGATLPVIAFNGTG